MGPKYLPESLLHYMRTRGKQKVIFASDAPVLSITRTVTEARRSTCPPEVLDNYLTATPSVSSSIGSTATPPDMADHAAVALVPGPWRERVVGRSLGPAAERAIERGQVIIAATGRLVQRNGVDFTMQQVAAEAGLSLRAIYQYFAGKDELLVALIEESAGVLGRLVDRAIESFADPLERLGAALAFMTDARQHTDHEYNAAMSRFVATTWTTEPDQVGRARRLITDLLARLIEAAADAGAIEAGDVTHQAGSVALAVNVYAMNSHLGSAIGVPVPPGLAFVRFLLLGLGAGSPRTGRIGWPSPMQRPNDAARSRSGWPSPHGFLHQISDRSVADLVQNASA